MTDVRPCRHTVTVPLQFCYSPMQAVRHFRRTTHSSRTVAPGATTSAAMGSAPDNRRMRFIGMRFSCSETSLGL